jgi:rhamnosyltransferase
MGKMNEANLSGVKDVQQKGKITEFTYHNAHVFKLPLPKIGSASAIYYDLKALWYSMNYCTINNITHPIIYILACRIGPFIIFYKKLLKNLGGKIYLNPDGHEWKREKWSLPIRKYWKYSEKLMVKHADLLICDSKQIEKYMKNEYSKYQPNTVYISYGSDLSPSTLCDDDIKFNTWLQEKGLVRKEYYLVVGRFVPENNYEVMIGEFMKSHSKRQLVLITNDNKKLKTLLEKKLNYSLDSRIKFVGTVYDTELLKKIRENAYGYLHGHEVGGTNPSLLEALGSTDLNLVFDVNFNREVAQNTALYWNKCNGDLSKLIDKVDYINKSEINKLSEKAKLRILSAYNWQLIADAHKMIWDCQEEQYEKRMV